MHMTPSATQRSATGAVALLPLDRSLVPTPDNACRYDRRGYAEDSDEDEDEYEFEDAQNLFDVIAEMFMQR